MAFVSEMKLSNTSAFDTSLAPRTIVGVPYGLMLVDVLLRRHAGVPGDPLRLALLALHWFAVYGTIPLTFLRLMQFTIIGSIFSKQAVWKVRRFIATAVFRGQNLAGNDC